MRFNGVSSFHQSASQDCAYSVSQLQMDAHQQAFAREGSNLSGAATLLGAGLSYQLGRTATWALLSNTSARWLPRVLAPLVALHLETATIHASHHLTGAHIATEHSNAYRSFYSTLLDIGVLKSIGVLSASFSSPLQHLFQSSGMVFSHRLASALDLNPAASSGFDNIFREILDAEIVNLQMETTALLGSRLGGTSLRAIQHTLHIQERMGASISRLNSEERIPVFGSQEITRFEDGLKPSRFLEASQDTWYSFLGQWLRSYRLWRFESTLRDLSPEARSNRVQSLLLSLREQTHSPTHVDFLLESAKRAYPHLSSTQIQRCAEICLQNFRNSEDPSCKARWLVTLKHLFPRLEGPLRLEGMREIAQSLVSPLPELARVADESFIPCLVYLERAELFDLATFMRGLDFHPVSSLERMQSMLDEVVNRLEITREDHAEQAIVEEAKLLGTYLSHDVFRVGILAHRRLVSLLQALSVTERNGILSALPSSLPENFLTHLRWVEEYERRQLQGDLASAPEIRRWEEDRYRRQMQALREKLQSLNPPPEWPELRGRITSMRALSELWQLQEALRRRLISNLPEDRRAIQTWWNRASSEELLLLLQLSVGSRGYWKLRGRDAMRLRNLASVGLGFESGVASKRSVIRDDEEVLFVLGNHNSVSVPQAFIEEFGISEAFEYLMIHHTHPTVGYNDFNQIYPSCYIEGSGSGDLYAMLTQMDKLQLQSPLAYSVMHEDGGSIFAIREEGGGRRLDIYTGRRNTLGAFALSHPKLREVRARIRNFAQQNGLEVRFWEVPFDRVERMHLPEQGQARPVSD